MAALVKLDDPGRSLFWTAPAADDSELATEDPLALDYVSQQLGLQLLPTLTTRSTRAQAFAMVLYGLALVERAIALYHAPVTVESRRHLFERWERFWALATLEFREGELPRGDPDAMRGVQGARAAWRPGKGPLPLDYPLISRQQELGNLGAYLSPLRRAGLVLDDLRPSAAALDIIDAFWDEADNKHRGRYHDYALLALQPDASKIERSHANLTLARVGEFSRLTSLTERSRAQQQRRLYDALLAQARDPFTAAVTSLVQAAVRLDIDSAADILDAAVAGRLGPVDVALSELLVTARRFGDAMAAMLTTFDGIYAAIQQEGWTASAAKIANAVLPPQVLAELQHAGRRLLDAPRANLLRGLPMHGAAYMRLTEQLIGADPVTALDAILGYHAAVQRERRRGEGWIRSEHGTLVLLVTSYTARPEADRFPSYKLSAVRQLLSDPGRLSSDAKRRRSGAEDPP